MIFLQRQSRWRGWKIVSRESSKIDLVIFLFTFIQLSVTLTCIKPKRRKKMVTDKKRVTISLSDERYSEFEKLVKNLV